MVFLRHRLSDVQRNRQLVGVSKNKNLFGPQPCGSKMSQIFNQICPKDLFFSKFFAFLLLTFFTVRATCTVCLDLTMSDSAGAASQDLMTSGPTAAAAAEQEAPPFGHNAAVHVAFWTAYFRKQYSNFPDALVLREEPLPEETDQEMTDVPNGENGDTALQAIAAATTLHTLNLAPLIGARARARAQQDFNCYAFTHATRACIAV
jgi:hypothetical protein